MEFDLLGLLDGGGPSGSESYEPNRAVPVAPVAMDEAVDLLELLDGGRPSPETLDVPNNGVLAVVDQAAQASSQT